MLQVRWGGGLYSVYIYCRVQVILLTYALSKIHLQVLGPGLGHLWGLLCGYFVGNLWEICRVTLFAKRVYEVEGGDKSGSV